jgi:hypothetical protein
MYCLSYWELKLIKDIAALDSKESPSRKSSSIESKLEKYKVDDAVTVDKKHSNDIQGAEEEDK